MIRFIIKVYRACERFPRGGQLTQYIEKKKVGEFLKISGPVGKCKYLGKGKFKKVTNNQLIVAKKISFIAGGTGITPFYQILQHLNDNNEKFDNDIKIQLLFANKSSKDIILRKELENLEKKNIIDDLKLCLDKADEDNWKGYEGFVEKPMLKKFLWEKSDDHCVIMCGPPRMNSGIIMALDDLEYENYFTY